MNNIKKVFSDYLLHSSSKALKEIINNLEVYKLILYFVKKNGIESFNFSKDEFAYRIFIVLKEYREKILVILNDENIDENKFIGKIANFILKDLNKQLYKKRRERSREYRDPEVISILPYIEKDKVEEKETLEDLNLKKEKLLKIINKESSFRYREALKSYFGLERPYALSFNIINKIFKVKKATFYFKLKQVKEK